MHRLVEFVASWGGGIWLGWRLRIWWAWHKVRKTWEQIQVEQEERRRREEDEPPSSKHRDSRDGTNGWH
jgi:hypothetical protein